jgi:hypothetical protein
VLRTDPEEQERVGWEIKTRYARYCGTCRDMGGARDATRQVTMNGRRNTAFGALPPLTCRVTAGRSCPSAASPSKGCYGYIHSIKLSQVSRVGQRNLGSRV